jgi:hypothetical protein
MVEVEFQIHGNDFQNTPCILLFLDGLLICRMSLPEPPDSRVNWYPMERVD